MKRACLLAALLAILLSVGCGKKGAGMSGTYKGRGGVPAGDATITFQDDGTLEVKSASEVLKGTYKLEGRNLTTTVTEVNGEPPLFKTEPTTATLSDDGRSITISGKEGQWTKQE